jgi:urea transport system ATP-binding protein
MSATNNILEIRQLNQYYGQSHILWDVDLGIPEGSCMCLMGRNGVGKTTLLKTVMGLLASRSGEIVFDGKELSKSIAETRSRLGVGYVPQGREIFGQLTVEENLKISLSAARGGASKTPNIVYELFPVLKDMRRRRGGDLSGGQQQQLAIGRALVLNPKLLILDEPTEGIQPNIVREIGDIIRRLNREQGLTVLLVEQKLPFARRVADAFTVLDKGRVVARGNIDQLNEGIVKQHLSV